MKGVAGVMVMVLALAACSPEKLATDVTRRTAKTVVLPVVRDVAPPPADTITSPLPCPVLIAERPLRSTT